ncbi:MAG: Na/Pi symporter [Kistimonas sp.]|nr:Na/Pi symporter [Kistimonas sp.]
MLRTLLLSAFAGLLLLSLWFYPQVLTILAGLALFLFGMLCLEQGFGQVSGGRLARLLRYSTQGRWSSWLTGILSTAILQSSSLSSVMAVSFVSTGIISLAAGLALVIGAGLGSTLGVWLIAAYGMTVSISHYAMPMLVLGTLLQLQTSGPRTRGGGSILLGIGFLLLGIHYIREGVTGAGDLSWLTADHGMLGGVLAGLALTVVTQSSHALLVVVMVALNGGLMELPQALALCIGTNIGTTTTALIAALGATTEGRKLALGNLFFKLIATVLILPLMPFWDQLATALGMAGLPVFQLALFHSLFNLVGGLASVLLVGKIEHILGRIFQGARRQPATDAQPSPRQPVRARLLTPVVMHHPDSAITALRTETANLYRRTVEITGIGLYLGDELLQGKEPVWPTAVTHPLPNWRIGKLYKQQVRGLYQDISRFCEQLEADTLPGLREPARAIRTACDNFVTAIKQLRLLQKSLRLYLRADAPVVREHYELLRYRVATTLHKLQELAQSTDEQTLTQEVTELKRELHRQDLLVGTALSVLLDDENTTADHITTLVKDNGTAHGICNNLIDGAVILLLQGQGAIISARQHDEENKHEVGEKTGQSSLWPPARHSTPKGPMKPCSS